MTMENISISWSSKEKLSGGSEKRGREKGHSRKPNGLC